MRMRPSSVALGIALLCVGWVGSAAAQSAETRCTAAKVSGTGAATRLRLDCEAIARLLGAPFLAAGCPRIGDAALARTWRVADRLGSCDGELEVVGAAVNEYADAATELVSEPNRLIAAAQLIGAGGAAQRFASCAAGALLAGNPLDDCVARGDAVLVRTFRDAADLETIQGHYTRYVRRFDLALLGEVLFRLPTPTVTSTETPTSTPTVTATATPTSTFTPTPTAIASSCGNYGQLCCLPDLTCLSGVPCLFTSGVDLYICRLP